MWHDGHAAAMLPVSQDRDQPPAALDEAQLSKLSNRSTAEIQRSQTLTTASQATAVHNEEVARDDTMDDEDEVSCLTSSPKKRWTPEKRFPRAPCIGCGGNHSRSTCRFKTAICRRCRKRGHLAKVCRASLPTSTQHQGLRTPGGQAEDL